ncbi:DUF1702 family protein [Planobispora siamensis]|uniref:DUF1702 family protein n=1 Tax=Planobispora siamensis TaxID=936338 RepID=A0A8J3WM52_9ACTN|nr:DUF1702 family protein [Planobispora siamensis]GIH96049.1 hypothetical protein Psi01_66790 [Planobispora siamensis]
MSNAEGTQTVAQRDGGEQAPAVSGPERTASEALGTPEAPTAARPSPGPAHPSPVRDHGAPGRGHGAPAGDRQASGQQDRRAPEDPKAPGGQHREPSKSEHRPADPEAEPAEAQERPSPAEADTGGPGRAGALRAALRGLNGTLRQDADRADFGRLRFRLGPARGHLETSLVAFLAGFNAVVGGETGRIDDLDEDVRGFAYEGAGMACATLDLLTMTGGRRLRELLSGQGVRYPHLIHSGAGCAYARMRLRPTWGIRAVHPLLRWLAFDGFGFHRGVFTADRTVGLQRTPRLMDRARWAIFDQGLGRALWLHECAGVDGLVLRLAEFPAGRRADLWSGVGMAAAYTGGAAPDDLGRLAEAAAAEGFRAHLAQGGAFACAVRLISGAVPAHTAAAAPVLCGAEVDEAAGWTDTALIALGHNAHSGEHYQAWRAGIRKAWARHGRAS